MRSLPEFVAMDPRQQRRSALRERQRVYQQFKDDEHRFRREQEAMLVQIFRNFMHIGRLPDNTVWTCSFTTKASNWRTLTSAIILHVVEVTGSLPRSMVESEQDPNAEIWDAIWTVGKRDMKVLVGVCGPGMARGKHCDAWQDEKRKQQCLPWRIRHRYGGGHQNDDCDCPRVEGWQNRTGSPFDDLYAGDTLHQSGRFTHES